MAWKKAPDVRLAPDGRAEALAAGCAPFVANGGTMREYVVLPAWLARAVAYTSTLPPKPRSLSENWVSKRR
jgi:hypothetical protein